jgi:F0F1-type ATP synthase alpha subunit
VWCGGWRYHQELEAAGCLDTTAVFFAAPDAPLGTKLATIMAAAAAGERVRDEGGHTLVVLDDLSPLSSELVWGGWK